MMNATFIMRRRRRPVTRDSYVASVIIVICLCDHSFRVRARAMAREATGKGKLDQDKAPHTVLVAESVLHEPLHLPITLSVGVSSAGRQVRRPW
jgi:hypothetical protein